MPRVKLKLCRLPKNKKHEKLVPKVTEKLAAELAEKLAAELAEDFVAEYLKISLPLDAAKVQHDQPQEHNYQQLGLISIQKG
jgi:uncharacterized membrane-anchored protein YjiN (DUF445 family)